jgi:ubiquitin-conjugating enzyme (huntingtin interacting protein 2)
MEAGAITRIRKEIVEWSKCYDLHIYGFNLEVIGDSYEKVRGRIRGPPDSPYADGTFELLFKMPNNYPWSPPSVRFLTKIWHPNVSSAVGTVCLNATEMHWTPSMTLRTTLLSLQVSDLKDGPFVIKIYNFTNH